MQLDVGFNLVGYATSPLGLGEDLRSFADMLDHLGIPFSVIDVPTESRGKVQVGWNHLTSTNFKSTFFFMAAGECLKLARLHPMLFEKNVLKVGYFPWELPDLPPSHQPALELVDHVWCPTSFVRACFSRATKKPVLSIPLPVPRCQDSGRRFREELKIPASAFVALFVFDVHSTLTRKNPQGAVEAFKRFVAKKQDAYLILKVNRGGPRFTRPAWIPDDRRILIITEDLSKADLGSLYSSANCYLSLHRSEGFGRTLVEAMQHQLPVISTKFSGPGDFLTSQNSLLISWSPASVGPGDYPDVTYSWWAEPSIEEAAHQLERLYHNRNAFRSDSYRTGEQFTVRALAKKYEPILRYYLKAAQALP